MRINKINTSFCIILPPNCKKYCYSKEPRRPVYSCDEQKKLAIKTHLQTQTWSRRNYKSKGINKHAHAAEFVLAAHSESVRRNQQHHRCDALYDHHYNHATQRRHIEKWLKYYKK